MIGLLLGLQAPIGTPYERLLEICAPLKTAEAARSIGWEVDYATMRTLPASDPNGRLDRMTALAVWTEVVRRFCDTMGRAERTLDSPGLELRPPGDSEVPSDATECLVRLGRLFAERAYVRIANGDNVGAERDLERGLLLSRRMAAGGMNAYSGASRILTKVSGVGILVIPSLGVAQLERLESFLDARLAEPEPFLAAVARGERELRDYYISAVLTPQNFVIPYFRDKKVGERVRDEVASRTPAERSALQAQIEREVHESVASLARRLERPEVEWYRGNTDPDPSAEMDVRTLDDYLERLRSDVVPNLAVQLQAVGVPRTQLRLLRLHAVLTANSWRVGRFPAQISEVETAIDPFSGVAFTYRRVEDRFRVWSEGRPDSGPIELGVNRRSSTNRPAKSP